MKNQKNVFVRFAIKFNQAASNSNTRINSLTEKATLIFYHLQGLAVILASSTLTAIPQSKLYGALGHVLRIFQLGFWTEITPITHEVLVVFFFAILILENAVILSFLYFVWKKKSVPSLLETAITYQILIANRYLLYIPLFQSSFYMIFNEKSETAYYAISIFNLTIMSSFKIFFIIISYRSAYSIPKFLAQYQNKELSEMIGFLIILGIRMSNYDTPSMTPTYLLFSMTCIHLITSLLHPTYLLSALNHLDLLGYSFTFGFTLVLILQATAYDGSKMEFPFLFVSSFIFWFMINIDGYRKEKVYNLIDQKTRSSLTMKYLPFLYEEFKQVDRANGKLIESIQPLLAHQSDNEDNQKKIFSSEAYSLESVPLKHKANKAFINFISQSYADYFKSPYVFRSGVQSIILAYLFFVKVILQDNLKVLFLIHDFRRKLKAKRLSFGWILGIQIARLEETCSHEYFSLKSDNVLDTSHVFKMLNQSDELISKMKSWARRKIAFLEELISPTVNLQVIKEKGIELVKNSKSILNHVAQQKDILKLSKTKNAMEFFAEEIIQDHDFLTFELKAISNMAYHASKLDFESLNTFQIIEKLHHNHKNPIFMLATEDYSGMGGRITHNTEYLIQQLGYTQSELSNLLWTDIIVAVEEHRRSTENDDSPDIRRDHNNNIRRTVHLAILRNRSGGFVAIHCTQQLDIIDDVLSMVLLGQEEPTYHQNFLLCKLDGTIEGPSKVFAEMLPDSTKFKGRKIQELLSLNHSLDYTASDQDGSIPLKGKLVLHNSGSSTSDANVIEINFLITRFDNAIPSKEGYYLINIYEAYISALFQKRNSVKDNRTRLFVSQLEIKTDVPQFEDTKSSKTLNFTSRDNLGIKKDELEFRSTDVLIVPAEESDLYRAQTPLEQKLGKLPAKIEAHHGFNPSSGQDTNSPEKSEIVSRRRMPLNSQELISGTQKNIISFRSFAKEVSASLTHKSSEDNVEALERKRNNPEFIKNQRASSLGYTANGELKQKRALERTKQNLKNPSVPLSIRTVKLFQIAICLGLIIYLIVDYVDLSGRYIILSELSGLTSFPIILLLNIYNFFQVEELFFSALRQLYPPETAAIWFFAIPSIIVDSAEDFNDKYFEYVVEASPEIFYPDFQYNNYTIDLRLPDTPYLNRAVDFHEALTVLRGYLYKVLIATTDGTFVHNDALSFLREQSLLYDDMLWSLNHDLFNRMDHQFDQLLETLQYRVLVGLAMAIFVGMSMFYMFYRLNKYSESLLSKVVAISGTELLDETTRLEKKAKLINGAENSALNKTASRAATKKVVSKDSQKKQSFSKKYLPLNKKILPKVALIIFVGGLYLIPPIVGYIMKADPVSHCLPLLRDYRIIAENAESAIGMTCHLAETVSLAAAGDRDQASNILNQTWSHFYRAKNLTAQLSNLLTNDESVHENHYVSANLTNTVASLRNNSYCELFGEPVSIELCQNQTNGLAAMGITAVLQKAIEWTSTFRNQLRDSDLSQAVAASLTFDKTLEDLVTNGYRSCAILGMVTDIYIQNFKEIAETANSSLLILLIVSLIYYVLLLVIFQFPVISWAERQYKEVREIYTLLPASSLLMNPYIKNMLKGKDRW